MKLVGKSTTKNYLSMIFELLLRMDSPHPFRMTLEDNQEDYFPLNNEYWCDLFSATKVKDNRKRAATQIKSIENLRAKSNYDSDESIRVPCKKRARTGVIHNCKQQGGNTTKHQGAQRYFVLFKKSGMSEQIYMLHSCEDCFGKSSENNSIKYGLVGDLNNSVYAAKQYKILKINERRSWRLSISKIKCFI